MPRSARQQNDSRQALVIRQKRSTKDTFRNIRNYLAGQFVGATRDDALLDEVLKCLFCKLKIERREAESLNCNADPFELATRLRKIFNAVRADFSDIYSENTEILLDPTTLSYVMRELEFSIMDAESDPVGDAFGVFVGSESKGNAGQFFTPRSVTNLLVRALDPQPHETVLDPACGAGGFLSSVCAYLEKKGVAPSEIPQHLYGIDKDAYLAQLALVHIALLTGGHPKIVNGDSISLQNDEKGIREYLPEQGVDIILTNPPFGAHIIAASPAVLKTFDLARKWIKDPRTGEFSPSNEVQGNVPPQVLFVERCLSLLRPGGRLGMVLPESILSNKSYRNVVEYLLKHADIHAIIGMPDALFKTSGKGGTHTKTCLLVATRNGIKNGTNSRTVFMAEAKWCGQDSRARVIPYNDLPEIADNFVAYRKGKLTKPSNLGFWVDKASIASGVLCPRYYDMQAAAKLQELENTHTLLSISQLISEGVISISTGDEVGKLTYETGSVPFIRTSDISNWELKAEPKHGLSRDIYEQLRSKQDVRPGDILMVKDGTYLIGTCAIVSEADREIVYQSHLYKIRVNPNQYGLNPYLMLAILSSVLVKRQIRSKQFTQDIIDSLGERINELILPVPKLGKTRERITSLVRQAVTKRITARELASEARTLLAF